MTGRPKTATCRVSEKIQTAHLNNTLRALDFFASVTSPFWNGLHI